MQVIRASFKCHYFRLLQKRLKAGSPLDRMYWVVKEKSPLSVLTSPKKGRKLVIGLVEVSTQQHVNRQASLASQSGYVPEVASMFSKCFYVPAVGWGLSLLQEVVPPCMQ